MKDTVHAPTLRPIPLQQHKCYINLLALLGRSATTIQLCDNARAVVQTRTFGRFGHLRTVTRGPLQSRLTSPDSRLKQYTLLRNDGIHLITPDTPDDTTLHAAGYRQIVTPSHTAMLDLTQTHAGRIAAMHGKWRNRLRAAKSQNLKLEIRTFNDQTDRWLLTNEARQQRVNRYRNWPVALTLAFAQANPNATWIAIARHKRDVIAAMLFLGHRPCVTYHIGWTSDAGRKAHAHTLLLDHAASYFSDRAYIQMDLGLIETERNPGLTRFKLGSGATPHKLGGTWLHLPGMRSHPLA